MKTCLVVLFSFLVFAATPLKAEDTAVNGVQNPSASSANCEGGRCHGYCFVVFLGEESETQFQYEVQNCATGAYSNVICSSQQNVQGMCESSPCGEGSSMSSSCQPANPNSSELLSGDSFGF